METIKSSIIGGMFFIFCISLTSVSAVELKTEFQSSYPKYYYSDASNSSVEGLCIDIIKLIEKETGIQIVGEPIFIPFKRIQHNLDKGSIDVFFGFAKNAKRQNMYTFVDPPLYEVNHVIGIRKDDSVTVATFDDIKALKENNVILTNSGTATERYLKKQGGLTIDSLADSLEMNFKKLLAKRGRFIYFHDIGLVSNIKIFYPNGEIKVLPASFRKYSHYVAFSKKTPDDVVKKVRAAIEKLSKNGELKKIAAKYSSFN